MHSTLGLPWWLGGKEFVCNVGDAGDGSLIFGLGMSPVRGDGNPLQCSCLGNPMNREAWWAAEPWGHKDSDKTWRVTNSNKARNDPGQVNIRKQAKLSFVK